MATLQNILLAMATVHCNADVTHTQTLGSAPPTTSHLWYTISLGDKCLATTEFCWFDSTSYTGGCDLYNGAQVVLWECDDDGYNKWFSDSPQGEIRAGNAVFDTYGRKVSDWCLDAGDIDAEWSTLSIWECNGLPQQQFNIDGWNPVFPWEGSLYLPNGKCVDGTESPEQGTSPIAWECNGQDQQMWSVCKTSMGWSHGASTCGTQSALV